MLLANCSYRLLFNIAQIYTISLKKTNKKNPELFNLCLYIYRYENTYNGRTTNAVT